MTVWDCLAACRRRWFVVLIGLVATIGSLVVVDGRPGVYWTQVNLVLLAPSSNRYPNALQASSGSLIALAGIIERKINAGQEQLATSSSDVAIVDLGVSEGSRIRLINSGNQWANNFKDPILDVQAAGRTEADALRELDQATGSVRTTLKSMEQSAGVDPYNQIRIEQSPLSASVAYRGGHRTQGALIASIVGIGLSISFAVLLDRAIAHPNSDGRRRKTAGREVRTRDSRHIESAPKVKMGL